MILFSFYNLNINSAYDLKDQIMLLDKELGRNQVLKKCPEYNITVLPYRDYSPKLLKNCIRAGYHPLNQNEIWLDPNTLKSIEKNSDEILIKDGNSYIIYVKDIHNIYSILRSKICEIIRECKLKTFPFGLHAALIGRDEELYLIIGTKGSGKTSAVLYALLKGWDVYTDEFVLIDRECIEVLERFPAITPQVEEKYFADCNFRAHSLIKGCLTGEYKKIIGINLKKCKGLSPENIKKVYVLTDWKNNVMLQEYRKSVFYSNVLIGSNMTDDRYGIIQDLIFKSIMTNIKDFSKEFLEERV